MTVAITTALCQFHQASIGSHHFIVAISGFYGPSPKILRLLLSLRDVVFLWLEGTDTGIAKKTIFMKMNV